ncbi:MAG TPA: extracellular solute-binding protein [Candidatus Paceibacterota bacterium]|nr:extracellular solute-binding protein [Candidatus Paceibacterota bacterium]
MSRFQLIFTGILVLLGVGGIIAFAVSKNTASQGPAAVVMWGSLSADTVNTFLGNVGPENQDTMNVTYVYKSPDSFESDLIAALARGAGPDMVLLPQDLILKQLDKFYVIPFASYSERSFKDAFIQEGELFLNKDGVFGLPFSIDPLVMYWNRDMFGDAGIAQAPTSWTQFFDLVPKLTKKSATGVITQSTIAFGEARNVVHFKDMLSLLSLQAGTPIVTRDAQGNIASAFNSRGTGLVPAEEALSYYTEFSNPLKSSYSWNRSLANDRTAFTAGTLAVYFGPASELRSIRAANPNLNFDVAMVPQTEGKRATFGSMNAIAILKSSPNVSAAFVAAATMTSQALDAAWINASGLPPVHRALLSKTPGDAYNAVFYQSALVSAAWLDPNREATTEVFGQLIESVTSGKLRVSESVNQASQEIDKLIRANNQ